MMSIYCSDPEEVPLPPDRVEKIILDVAFAFYDGASNGNRTRGNVRKASDMYVALSCLRPTSDTLVA